jgi:hypothetical protein
MSLRAWLRRLLDAEAQVEPLPRPRITDALDPFISDPRDQLVENEVRRLHRYGQAEVEERTSEDGEGG